MKAVLRRSLKDRFRPSIRDFGVKGSTSTDTSLLYSLDSIYENLFKTNPRMTAELLSPVKTALAAGAAVVLKKEEHRTSVPFSE